MVCYNLPKMYVRKINNELLDIVTKISIDKLRLDLLTLLYLKRNYSCSSSTFKILIDSKVIPPDTILKGCFNDFVFSETRRSNEKWAFNK